MNYLIVICDLDAQNIIFFFTKWFDCFQAKRNNLLFQWEYAGVLQYTYDITTISIKYLWTNSQFLETGNKINFFFIYLIFFII